MNAVSTTASAEWLAPTDLAKVAAASGTTLRRTLLTCDGAGERIKAAALSELLARAVKADPKQILATLGYDRENSSRRRELLVGLLHFAQGDGAQRNEKLEALCRQELDAIHKAEFLSATTAYATPR